MLGPAAKERMAMMLIAGGLLVALLFSYATRPPKRHDPGMGGESWQGPAISESGVIPAELSPEALERCRRMVASAQENGLIRERPQADQIAVDEQLWAGLRPVGQSQLLRAVACDTWKRAAPPEGERLVAYGWMSGRRLSVLSGMRGRR